MCDGGLSPHHAVSDAVLLLDILGNGCGRSDQLPSRGLTPMAQDLPEILSHVPSSRGRPQAAPAFGTHVMPRTYHRSRRAANTKALPGFVQFFRVSVP
jgi:hypothetical protein